MLLRRSEMIDVAQRYLAAVTRHDPACAPLHPALRSTENGKALRAGEGYWRIIEQFAGEAFFDEIREILPLGATSGW